MLDQADALEGKLKLAEAEAKQASKGKDRESQEALKALRTELKS